MNVIAAMLLSLAAPAADARSNPISAAETTKARDLIKQLADPRYKVRAEAEKQLISLGLASLEALKEGEKNADLHVQERCRLLQPMIRGFTLQKRIDAFLANRDGPGLVNLPLAASFLKLTEDSKEARKLYSEVLLINPQLLDLIEQDKTKGLNMFTAYCQQVNQRLQYVPGVDYQKLQRSITRADVALYFLLSSQFSDDRSGRVSNYGHTFINAPILPETLAKDEAAALPFKKLFLNWIEKEPQPYMVQRAMQIASDAKMKEALPLVLKLIERKDLEGYARAQTALLLTRVGSKEHIKLMEPFLEDKAVIGNFGINNKQAQVQMRDVALAVCIKLSGQKMSTYPFDVMQGSDENLHMSYVYCAFSGDDKRDAALKQYKESKERDPKAKDANYKDPKAKDPKDVQPKVKDSK